jgi:hypothetical protein
MPIQTASALSPDILSNGGGGNPYGGVLEIFQNFPLVKFQIFAHFASPVGLERISVHSSVTPVSHVPTKAVALKVPLHSSYILFSASVSPVSEHPDIRMTTAINISFISLPPGLLHDPVDDRVQNIRVANRQNAAKKGERQNSIPKVCPYNRSHFVFHFSALCCCVGFANLKKGGANRPKMHRAKRGMAGMLTELIINRPQNPNNFFLRY